MCKRTSILLLMGCLGITSLAVAQTPPTDVKQIGDLIEKLGSPRFQERAAAQKQLDGIGPAALAILKKAVASDDPEVSKRAGELVRKIEERQFNAAMLAPKMVRLNLADHTIKGAVAELAKTSGYPIPLEGSLPSPEKRLTFDTGVVTFWEALDKLSTQAGLVEKTHAWNVTMRARASASGLTLWPGTPQNQHLSYAGSVRSRVYPLPKTKTGEYRLMLEVSAEPRLGEFSLIGTPAIEKAVDEGGRHFALNGEAGGEQILHDELLVEPLLSSVDGDIADGSHRHAILYFTPWTHPSKTLAELRGSLTAHVMIPPEALLTVDKVMASTRKAAIGKSGETLNVLEVQAIDPGEYKIRVTWTVRRLAPVTLPPFRRDQIKAAGASERLSAAYKGLMPELLDVTGHKFAITNIEHAVGIHEDHQTHSAVIIYRGQGEPDRLTLIGARLVTISVPFEFRNVPLE